MPGNKIINSTAVLLLIYISTNRLHQAVKDDLNINPNCIEVMFVVSGTGQ